MFITISSVYLILSQSEKKWFYVLLGLVIFVLTIALYKYAVYRNVYRNFNNILEQTGGSLEKGNYFLGVPHRIKFIYLGKICQIGHSIDPKLDYMIEYVCQTNKELELRIIRRNVRRLKKEIPLTENIILNKEYFNKKFIVAGENKTLMDIILSEPKITRIIEELMQDFNYLYIGKDGKMRLLQRYDIHLTKPEIAFLLFHKITQLVDFLESKI